MSTAAEVALRAAIHTALSGDAQLASLLGGPKIYDEAPRGAQLPYVTFGDLQSRDWSTSDGDGVEHFITLNAWSGQTGAREALAIAGRIRELLHDQPLAVSGYALVNLRFMQLDTRRESNGRFTRASPRFRAVTEPL